MERLVEPATDNAHGDNKLSELTCCSQLRQRQTILNSLSKQRTGIPSFSENFAAQLLLSLKSIHPPRSGRGPELWSELLKVREWVAPARHLLHGFQSYSRLNRFAVA
jgi:hypothetical protein